MGSNPASRMFPPPPGPLPHRPAVDTVALRRLPLPDLEQLAATHGVFLPPTATHAEVVNRVQRALLAKGEPLVAEGTLELEKAGHGFLRNRASSYLPHPADLYVPVGMIARFGLRTGDEIHGTVRPPRGWQKFLALAQIDAVNGLPPEQMIGRANFDTLRPKYPDQRIRLESTAGGMSMRLADLIAPLGKGQRGLIVAPPRAGKTMLLHRMANAIAENHPEVVLFVLLIDERPEEVTDFIANCPTAEVVASTFDEKPTRHVQVADMVIEKAKRLVESGRDVVILLDSITRLARAHNAVTPMSGKILSGGVDAKALEKPKRFFGAARRIDGGGSLTIVATALVSTGSRMDEVIFEEFKGTGNMEIVLDRDIANRRVYPAFEVNKSGTRKEELLLTDTERNRIFLLRHFVGSMMPEDATQFILRRLAQTDTNEEFFQRMAEGQ